MNKKFLITAISVAFAGFLTFGTTELKAGEVSVNQENTVLNAAETVETSGEETVNETAVIDNGISETEEGIEGLKKAEDSVTDFTSEEVTAPVEAEELKEEAVEDVTDEEAEDTVVVKGKKLVKKTSKKSLKAKSKAVKNFVKFTDKKSGKSLKNTGSSKTVIKLTDEEFKMLACTIFVEGGNQPFSGKVAIANVVINRVKSGLFPNSVKSVLHQKTYSRGRTFYQFAIVKPGGTLPRAMAVYGRRAKGSWQAKAEVECIRAARAALNGQKTINDNHFFFMVANQWIKSSRRDGIQIAAHYFYR